jgi:hypothetical protein
MSKTPEITKGYRQKPSSAWELDDFADHWYGEITRDINDIHQRWLEGSVDAWTLERMGRVVELAGRIMVDLLEATREENDTDVHYL